MKLSIIIVNTNEGRFLPACLTTLYRETNGITFEVFLVDNASTDGSVELVARDFPNVKILRNKENKGFAASNNVALRESTGEYVLLLNPDTEILDGAIPKTVSFMESHPRVGIAGCKLLYPDRTVQQSVRGFPSILGVFLESTFLYLLLPRNKIVRRRGIATFDYSRTEEVDWLIGAYFLIRRNVLDTIGLLDEQFWIYGEEVDYCQRAKHAGFETWFIADVAILHLYGGMTAISRRAIVWLQLGHRLYVDKQYTGIERFAIISLRHLGAAVRVVVYSVMACLTLNTQLFTKASYFLSGLLKVLTLRLRYDRNHTREVVPWTKYL